MEKISDFKFIFLVVSKKFGFIPCSTHELAERILSGLSSLDDDLHIEAFVLLTPEIY